MKKESNVKQAFLEYKERLTDILGDKISEVYLYGSHARGDADEDSDIDVVLVIRGAIDYSDLIHQTSEITSQISLKYDVVLSRSFVSEEDFSTRQTPFLINVRKDKVLL